MARFSFKSMYAGRGGYRAPLPPSTPSTPSSTSSTTSTSGVTGVGVSATGSQGFSGRATYQGQTGYFSSGVFTSDGGSSSSVGASHVSLAGSQPASQPSTPTQAVTSSNLSKTIEKIKSQPKITSRDTQKHIIQLAVGEPTGAKVAKVAVSGAPSQQQIRKEERRVKNVEGRAQWFYDRGLKSQGDKLIARFGKNKFEGMKAVVSPPVATRSTFELTTQRQSTKYDKDYYDSRIEGALGGHIGAISSKLRYEKKAEDVDGKEYRDVSAVLEGFNASQKVPVTATKSQFEKWNEEFFEKKRLSEARREAQFKDQPVTSTFRELTGRDIYAGDYTKKSRSGVEERFPLFPVGMADIGQASLKVGDVAVTAVQDVGMLAGGAPALALGGSTPWIADEKALKTFAPKYIEALKEMNIPYKTYKLVSGQQSMQSQLTKDVVFGGWSETTGISGKVPASVMNVGLIGGAYLQGSKLGVSAVQQTAPTTLVGKAARAVSSSAVASGASIGSLFGGTTTVIQAVSGQPVTLKGFTENVMIGAGVGALYSGTLSKVSKVARTKAIEKESLRVAKEMTRGQTSFTGGREISRTKIKIQGLDGKVDFGEESAAWVKQKTKFKGLPDVTAETHSMQQFKHFGKLGEGKTSVSALSKTLVKGKIPFGGGEVILDDVYSSVTGGKIVPLGEGSKSTYNLNTLTASPTGHLTYSTSAGKSLAMGQKEVVWKNLLYTKRGYTVSTGATGSGSGIVRTGTLGVTDYLPDELVGTRTITTKGTIYFGKTPVIRTNVGMKPFVWNKPTPTKVITPPTINGKSLMTQIIKPITIPTKPIFKPVAQPVTLQKLESIISTKAAQQFAAGVSTSAVLGSGVTGALSMTQTKSVTVTQTKPVTIASTKPITITNVKPITTNLFKPVTITSTKPITITNVKPVTITNVKPITITGVKTTQITPLQQILPPVTPSTTPPPVIIQRPPPPTFFPFAFLPPTGGGQRRSPKKWLWKRPARKTKYTAGIAETLLNKVGKKPLGALSSEAYRPLLAPQNKIKLKGLIPPKKKKKTKRLNALRGFFK